MLREGVILALLALLGRSTAFVSHQPTSKYAGVAITQLQASDGKDDNFVGGIFAGIGNMFAELDAFIDDASARRLGNGAAFYGKRKSSFYGKEDKNKKADRDVFDPSEDYRGPAKAGYFQWMPDENGEMRPVTRMKKRIVERK